MKLNTADNTAIISSGLRTLHNTPKVLRLYFSLKSLDTRVFRMKSERFLGSFSIAFNLIPFMDVRWLQVRGTLIRAAFKLGACELYSADPFFGYR